jgi:nucleoside-diphosphate-sugar epimerase
VRVLVTGSVGFLGRHFVRAHAALGDYVLGVDDLSAHADLEALPGDVMDVTDVIDAMDWFRHDNESTLQWDIAYHFAAPVGGRVKIEGDPLFNAHSLGLDEVFFRWASEPGRVGQVVYPSSSAVYGRVLQSQDDSGALSEDRFHPEGGIWWAPDEMYGFTKLAGEVLAWKAAIYGLSSLCIRPFSGYGEGQSFDYPVPSIAARALRREDPLTIWGSGQQARDFVHVDDIVRVTQARLAKPWAGYEALNIGSGHATTFREVAEIFAQEVGYSPVIVTDESKPEGVKRRWATIDRQRAYINDLIPLRDGLRRVLTDVEQRLKTP